VNINILISYSTDQEKSTARQTKPWKYSRFKTFTGTLLH